LIDAKAKLIPSCDATERKGGKEDPCSAAVLNSDLLRSYVVSKREQAFILHGSVDDDLFRRPGGVLLVEDLDPR
jgi:hypothetical protein